MVEQVTELAALCALTLCTILAVGQLVVVYAFARKFRSSSGENAVTEFRPAAAVVLALRGPDPYLIDCLTRLLRQDYEDYKVLLVVDHAEDPVLQDIERLRGVDGFERLQICFLESPFGTCSLKCSSLVRAVEQIDSNIEVVAFLDGDVLPHTRWLAELITPLANESVGVTTGNRWFVPSTLGWGAWIRYCWNVGAVVQVWLNQITWAGSMAIRTSTIREVGLIQAWQRALSVDATVHRQMREHGLRIQFVPSVMMVNREGITTGNFVRWVQRQLLAAKSCGSSWRLIGLHAANLFFTQLLAIAMFAGGIASGNLAAALMAGCGIVIYWASSMISIGIAELAIRKGVARNGEVITWQRGWGDPLRVCVAMLFTQAVYPYALATALLKRRVSWRGIEYEIHGAGNVEMVKYYPYSKSTRQSDAAESVI
jgi:cellulose synthase/poly-beta-1,6-N-acetylglucosamine synthase-like glycosyltransferase